MYRLIQRIKIAKELPAKSFKIDYNPQKVGSDSKTAARALQAGQVSRA